MIFVDSGAIIARLYARDPFHEEAVAGFEKLERSDEGAFTTPLCIAESLGVLARATNDFRRTAHRGLDIMGWTLEVVRPTAVEERHALLLMESYADEQVGYVDCVSFVVMDARGSRTAFTFDAEHFVRIRKLRPWVPIPKKKR